MASIMAVSNETKTSTTRMTKEGRQLRYELEVIQQPERARACGSGAKSSADRRPVDPPPVVQLKIYESDSKNEITFSHNANFFLFATLEPARQIAHGRVSTGTGSASFPVLTGMPVAGMAYLDRPTAGGYFIFPDLSVRHEGKFRLSFNLYEEIKEAKDEDVEPIGSTSETKDIKPPRPQGTAPKNFSIWRMEVKSIPFSVYSAKKFPGLAESTNLSRVVAEQGCRVRIRRDVRMRRRDNRSKDYDDCDDNSYSRQDRFATPVQQIPERPRSISNGSVHGSVHGSVEPTTPYSLEHRRSSQDLSYSYTQPSFAQAQAPQQPVQTPSSFPSQLAFGSTSSQYAAASFQPPSAPVSQTSQRYAQVGSDYQYQPNSHARQMSASHNYAYSPSQPQTPIYPQPQASIYPSGTPEVKPIVDFRRTSLPASQQTYTSQPIIQYNQPDTRQTTSYTHLDSRQTASYAPGDTRQHPAYQQMDARQGSSYPQADSRSSSMQQSYYTPAHAPIPRTATPSSNSHILPPIQTLQAPTEPKYETYSPSTVAAPPSGPSSSSSYDTSRKSYHSYPTSAPTTTVYDPARSTGKRPHENAFDSSHQYQSLHNGMRPGTYNHGQDVSQIETDEGTLVDEYEMRANLVYRRADGTRQSKKMPSPVMD